VEGAGGAVESLWGPHTQQFTLPNAGEAKARENRGPDRKLRVDGEHTRLDL